jgi:ribosomal protein S27AE
VDFASSIIYGRFGIDVLCLFNLWPLVSEAKREVASLAGHCPGQDGRELQVSLHKCPNCGAEVEMFSDEIRAKCHACGKYVSREQVPSCVQWCAKARECLGEERWRSLMSDEGDDQPRDEDV